VTTALPTGTVTFLFTDIEGSTRLLQDLGDRYGEVRDAHAAILRRAIRDGHGVEVSTEGDSFFAAFASPAAAVRAAVAAQRGQVIVSDPTRVLVEHDLPDGVSLRDLGTHRLKDLNLPMRLHDLVVAGLPADFPAPRTLDAQRATSPRR
jgi:class 3 adenylate cyclase